MAEVEIAQQASAASPEGSTLPLGASQQLEEAFDVPDVEEDFTDLEVDDGLDDEEDDFDTEEPEVSAPSGDIAALFTPTRFSDRPVTSGLSVGPGPADTALPNEGPRAYLQRVAQRMAASPSASPGVRAWAERVTRGE